MKSILDPSFRYTPSFGTDLHKTFERIRRDQRREAERVLHAPMAAVATVSPIFGKTSTRR